MRSRSSFAPIAMACVLALALLGTAPAANAELGGHSVQKSARSAGHSKVKIKRPVQGVRIHLPVGPSQVYYDYPYYYSRGHYPTHIGGYVYYRCFNWRRGCIANWDPAPPRRQGARGN